MRGGRRRRGRGPRRDRRRSADRADLHAAELRFRWELPAQGAHRRWRSRVATSACRCTSRRPPPPPTWPPRTASRTRVAEAAWRCRRQDDRAARARVQGRAPTTSAIRPPSGWPSGSSAGGAAVRGYDPAARLERRGAPRRHSRSWMTRRGPLPARTSIVIATEWPEFRELAVGGVGGHPASAARSWTVADCSMRPRCAPRATGSCRSAMDGIRPARRPRSSPAARRRARTFAPPPRDVSAQAHRQRL